MTRYELINAITKKAGVSEIEATAFFEIFMMRISGMIKPNQAASLEGVGYFNTRKGLAKKNQVAAGTTEEEGEDLDLIIFAEKLEDIEDLKNNHMFIIPKPEADDYNEIDSHFSLSINKPVISEQSSGNENSASSRESFQSLYGKELKKYLVNKAENLINAVHVDEYISDKTKDAITELPESAEQNFSIISHDQVQNIARDLGDGIPHQVEEEDPKVKKLKLSQSEEEKRRMESLPWNYGKKFQVKKIAPQDEEKHDLSTEDRIAHEQLYERKPEPFRVGKPKNPEGDNKTDINNGQEGVSKEELESEISEIIGNYQRVKPFLSGVKDKIDSPETEDKKDKKSSEIIKPSPTLLRRDPTGYLEVKSKSESLHLREPIKPKGREWKKESARKENYRDDSESFYGKPLKKNNSSFIYFIVAAALITLGAVYLYIDWENIFTDDTVEIASRPPDVNEIEPDYSIPDEYPSESTNSENGISDAELENTENQNLTEQKESIDKPTGKEKGIEINTEPIKSLPVTVKKKEEPKITEKVVPPPPVEESNVAKAGDYYNVVMGVYDSNEIAEKEAEKYNDIGYNAFVQSVVIPGKGVKYRLRVGDFTSEEKAIKFKNLHSK